MNDSQTKDDKVTLELLDAIEQRSDISQRTLSAELGIALGLTNSYLKRCAKKGYVKIKAVPANRYLYYLTPKGLSEKSRLTARFLSTSLTFYRQAAESCSDLYRVCQEKKWRRAVLCGASDLAEIAFMRSATHDVEVIGVYDRKAEVQNVLSLPVWQTWDVVGDADVYLITGLEDALSIYKEILGRGIEPDRVLVPKVLGLDSVIGKHVG